MKIVASPPSPRPYATIAAPTSGHVSFAAFLAEGRSVKTIAGGRAFGFAETGIFGVYGAQATVAHTNAVATGPVVMTRLSIDTAPDIASRARPGSVHRAIVARPQTMRATPLALPIVSSPSPFPVNGVELVDISGIRPPRSIAPDVGADAQNMTSAKMPGTLRMSERRRILAVALADGDDSAVFCVGMPVDGELPWGAVIAEIEKLSVQFGVTVDRITIDGKRVRHLHPNNNKDR